MTGRDGYDRVTSRVRQIAKSIGQVAVLELVAIGVFGLLILGISLLEGRVQFSESWMAFAGAVQFALERAPMAVYIIQNPANGLNDYAAVGFAYLAAGGLFLVVWSKVQAYKEATA